VEMALTAKSAIEPMGAALQPALESIARCKARLSPPSAFSVEAFQHIDAEIRDLRIATLGESEADTRSPEDGKRSPVELY